MERLIVVHNKINKTFLDKYKQYIYFANILFFSEYNNVSENEIQLLMSYIENDERFDKKVDNIYDGCYPLLSNEFIQNHGIRKDT